MARTQLETALHTLLDLLDEAVAANGDKNALSLRLDDGSTTSWTYRDLDRRSRLAAWRLRALGLEAGDRLLTWSPSTCACQPTRSRASSGPPVPNTWSSAPGATPRTRAKPASTASRQRPWRH